MSDESAAKEHVHYETIVRSDATVRDALNLLSLTLRKCRIEPMDVIVVIPDVEVRQKLEKPRGLGEKFLSDTASQYNRINQFICRWRGITIVGPGRLTAAQLERGPDAPSAE
jgi:hypothetical protein